jgi:sulfite exporter TauE/SafE
MSERSAIYLIVVGLLLALGGTGGVEHSVTDAELLQSLLVAVMGALVMWCGTLGLRNSKYFG